MRDRVRVAQSERVSCSKSSTGGSALLCGYEPCLEGLWNAAQRALWVLREEPDGETLRQRFAQFGFEPRKPPEPRLPRRRKLPRPAAEDFLIRNALGPPSWSGLGGLPDPGSETEPEEEAPDYEARKAQRQREDQDQDRSFAAFLQQGAQVIVTILTVIYSIMYIAIHLILVYYCYCYVFVIIFIITFFVIVIIRIIAYSYY